MVTDRLAAEGLPLRPRRAPLRHAAGRQPRRRARVAGCRSTTRATPTTSCPTRPVARPARRDPARARLDHAVDRRSAGGGDRARASPPRPTCTTGTATTPTTGRSRMPPTSSSCRARASRASRTPSSPTCSTAAGPGVVVVMDGARGSRVTVRDGGGFAVPALEVTGRPVVDSNGAGDAYVSGFLTAWLAGGGRRGQPRWPAPSPEPGRAAPQGTHTSFVGARASWRAPARPAAPFDLTSGPVGRSPPRSSVRTARPRC